MNDIQSQVTYGGNWTLVFKKNFARYSASCLQNTNIYLNTKLPNTTHLEAQKKSSACCNLINNF
jgi:hypothetical protein